MPVQPIGPPPKPFIGPPPPRHKQAPVKKPPVSHGLAPVRYIHFYGVDPQDPSKYWSFDVLPGDQPPTPVGGYANWQQVQRPLWRSLTVFQGYDSLSLSFGVRFMPILNGSWLDDDQAGGQMEIDIAALETIAGMGRESGAPPYLYLSTSDGQGNTSPLIPFQYQDSPTPNVPKRLRNRYLNPWVITDLEWDQQPIRNRSGYRIRQDATVTVTEFQGGTSPAPSVAHRGTKQTAHKATEFTSRAGADTALGIAAAAGTAADRFTLARAIVAFQRNQPLHLRSIRQTIKHGTRVWIPYNY